jgi:hypothetical protein
VYGRCATVRNRARAARAHDLSRRRRTGYSRVIRPPEHPLTIGARGARAATRPLVGPLLGAAGRRPVLTAGALHVLSWGALHRVARAWSDAQKGGLYVRTTMRDRASASMAALNSS